MKSNLSQREENWGLGYFPKGKTMTWLVFLIDPPNNISVFRAKFKKLSHKWYRDKRRIQNEAKKMSDRFLDLVASGHCWLRHFESGRRKTGSRMYLVLIAREVYHNAMDRTELRFALRTTCKQLNSIRKRSHYIRLLLTDLLPNSRRRDHQG